ncbi:hypothetical protein SAMN05192554_1206 [Haloarchaeobius iranensis]|uniref:Uncharacterized protein n=1 Tax=Haloarchaeobius iranensis TaxID=996166 RepID=A0A1G9ZGK1_9EURY|nr:hypothetical protein SAMN05192554_1206 [Haloarchaeobius iranensis]
MSNASGNDRDESITSRIKMVKLVLEVLFLSVSLLVMLQ